MSSQSQSSRHSPAQSPRKIKTWADWEAALESNSCTPAEKKLVAACQEGRECVVGTGDRPSVASPQNAIGADLLRYLIKGGCANCDLHDWGVELYGAYITGPLDLRMVKAAGVTGLINCHFEAEIDALNAEFAALVLNGSHCPALRAQGIVVKGSVFLNNDFSAKGEVSLSSAVIGGQLDCSDGRFENTGGDALNAQDIEVKGSVFLRDGFSAKGEVRLAGAVIGGQLDCSDGRFENTYANALNAQNAEMSSFLWSGVQKCDGDVILANAKTKDLVDDAASWALAKRCYLDGFTYQTITGPLDAEMRLGWLANARASDGGFSPHPYEQLAWVLKRMGHGETRRVILVEKEKRQRSNERRILRFRRVLARLVSRLSATRDEQSRDAVNNHLKDTGKANKDFVTRLTERYDLLHNSWPKHAEAAGTHQAEVARAQAGFREGLFWENGRLHLRLAWLHFKDQMARRLVGYGYRPFNFIWALALLIVIGWVAADQAYEHGDFAPNSDVILSTPEWQALAEGDSVNPAEDWSSKTGKGRDYETFNSLAYAVDVVIPIVAIGQEAAWAPSTNRGPWGELLWGLRWVLTILGWIVTAVGAAAITGIIRRD